MARKVNLLENFAADCRTQGLAEGSIMIYVSRSRQFSKFLQERDNALIQADKLDIRDYVEELGIKGNRE